jgi:hypothetical protein
VQAFPKCVTIRGLKDGHSAYYCNNLLQYDGSGRFTGLDRFGGAAEGAVKLRWTATAMSRPASPPAGTRLP